MPTARTSTALAGLLLSLLITAALSWYFESLVFLFVLPFLPLLGWRKTADDEPARRTCPACGFSTRDPDHRYCPRDGTELQD
ncbi:MAG: hypothetical protein ABEJ35_03015 [Halobacteriaceae archaeon]